MNEVARKLYESRRKWHEDCTSYEGGGTKFVRVIHEVVRKLYELWRRSHEECTSYEWSCTKTVRVTKEVALICVTVDTVPILTRHIACSWQSVRISVRIYTVLLQWLCYIVKKFS